MQNNATKLNNAELAVSLLCKGLKLSDQEKQNFQTHKRRAGLGSGLEIVLPGAKDIWINVPIQENFVAKSPYSLTKEGSNHFIHRDCLRWPVRLPILPGWYQKKTSSGIPMSRIGVLQGTYLGIYVGNRCAFWRQTPSAACRFCASGINVGAYEQLVKSVDDIVETAKEAKKQSGITFVHLNSGYQEGNDLKLIAPYVKALKEKVGILVGVQCIPPKKEEDYRPLLEMGVDHFSLCYEFHHPEYFSRLLPGKNRHIGQERFFRALRYLCRHMPRGSVSGEIIAGIEPKKSTLEAIDFITNMGAFPTVCIFRPLEGTPLENEPSPDEQQMSEILCYAALSCLHNKIPMGLVPNLEVSLVMTPDDARFLLPRNAFWYYHHYRLALLRPLAHLYFAWKRKQHPTR